jgi:hypothetical protein
LEYFKRNGRGRLRSEGMSKPREWWIDHENEYAVFHSEESAEGDYCGAGYTFHGEKKPVHVIEYSAYAQLRADAEKLVEALEKTIKENTIMLNEQKCARNGHDWEPDTSLTIMRCDRCGLGMNTNDSRRALADFRKRWPKEGGK